MNDRLFKSRVFFIKLFTFVIVFGAIIGFVFLVFNSNKSNGYYIVDETLILVKNGNVWNQETQFDSTILKNKYNVYGQFGSKKDVILNYSSNRWYYMDANYKDLSLNRVRLATNKSNQVKLADYKIAYYNSSDYNYVKQAIGKKNVSQFEDGTVKYSCDIDGDGISEIFYTITNERLANVDFESASIKNYSTIIMIKNNKIYKLDTDTSSPFSINDIIDLDGDGKYEIIVSKGVLDTPTFDSCYQIYNFKDDKFERLMDCK